MSLKTKNKAENEAEYRNLIEAALYVSGRPLDLKKLSSISGLRSRRILMRLLRQLKEDYAQRQTSIEIVELEDQRYVMQLKPEYTNKVQRLSVRPLLTQGPLKTLSFI
ncbi:MAG: SMC-Scp complex subunit ScpB, partial [Candidatus Bathyarchaeia archaeon]